MYFFSLMLFNASMKTIDEIRRENLATLVAEAGSITALAKTLDRDVAQVSQWLNGSINSGTGKPRGIRSSSCRFIEEQCGKPSGWMEVEHVGEPSKKAFDVNVSPVMLASRPIPVISSVQAGALRDMENPYEPGDGYAIEYTEDQKLSRWAFCLDVEGMSMSPRFQPGDRLFVDPDRSPGPGNFVVARNGSNQATFKKYRPRGIDANGNEIFELVPLNDDFPTLRSDSEPLYVIGVVTEVKQRLV
jgi:SOS-response transcriptional repressor LexA